MKVNSVCSDLDGVFRDLAEKASTVELRRCVSEVHFEQVVRSLRAELEDKSSIKEALLIRKYLKVFYLN